MLFFFNVHPAIRVAAAAVVVGAGIAVHRELIVIIGAALGVIALGQWAYRARNGGPRR